jgi:hypothetical protein
MLVIWPDHQRQGSQNTAVADAAELDTLLDRLHQQARTSGHPDAIQLYPGHRYPQPGHFDHDTWIPDDPGDGPLPELLLTVGADVSPVYWDEPGGIEDSSTGTASTDEPEFEYLHSGQLSYAPAWSLVPTAQARQAARLFVTSGGKRPANITWHTEHETV